MEIGPASKPLAVFNEWLEDAKKTGLREPTAMTLATADAAGEVHARVVLCRGWSEDGFVFYTNYESQKGADVRANRNAAAVFFWDALARQVRVTGTVEKTSREMSDAYWSARARDSQLSQYISHQSQPVASREVLEKAWQDAERKFHGKEIPCPEHWGGYLLRPKTIEFWVGQPGRLHDRHVFEKLAGSWTYGRLSP
jgi:pyridoxamine 5'-phosphate oxidase